METGSFRTRNLPYGYLWNEDKTAYVVDAEAAAVVRQIFQWKRQEISVYAIVERLKADGVESPKRHKRKAGTRSGDNIQGEGWCPSTIQGILQNRAYIGELICGKSEKALYKGLKKRVTEKANWIVVSDAHPPIISIAEFEAVERQMREDSSHRTATMEWSADIRARMIDFFDRKIFCADCGKRMYYKRQRTTNFSLGTTIRLPILRTGKSASCINSYALDGATPSAFATTAALRNSGRSS